MRPHIDEIREYINGRFLPSTEAAWRLLGFNITSKEPSVEVLPVHLPGQNFAQFAQGNSGEVSTTSLLIRYSNRPHHLPEFANLSYMDHVHDYILTVNP